MSNWNIFLIGVINVVFRSSRSHKTKFPDSAAAAYNPFEHKAEPKLQQNHRNLWENQ